MPTITNFWCKVFSPRYRCGWISASVWRSAQRRRGSGHLRREHSRGRLSRRIARWRANICSCAIRRPTWRPSAAWWWWGFKISSLGCSRANLGSARIDHFRIVHQDWFTRRFFLSSRLSFPFRVLRYQNISVLVTYKLPTKARENLMMHGILCVSYIMNNSHLRWRASA